MKRLCCMVLLLCLFPVFSCAESELRGLEEALFNAYLDLYSLPRSDGPFQNGKTTVFVGDGYQITLSFDEKDGHFTRGLLSYKKPFDFDFIGTAVCMINAFFGHEFYEPLLNALAHFHGTDPGLGYTDNYKDALMIKLSDEGYPQLIIKLNWENK